MKSILKKLISIILVAVIFSTIIVVQSNADVTLITNSDDQYMELKVVSIEDVAGADKQVTLEWWSYNLKFKGIDLRFSYDNTKIKPSNITNNEYVTDSDGDNSFAFSGDFASYMDYFTVQVEDGTYRCVMSLIEYNDSGTYIENDPTLGYVVNTNVDGGVLIGKMSFRLYTDDDLLADTFALQTSTTSPTTGIKITQTSDGTNSTSYQDQSVFRFSVMSNDATLKKISYDFFNYNKDDNSIPNLTYKDIDLTNPDSDSTDNLIKYTINLNEIKDNISLKINPNEGNATVKVNGTDMDITKSKELVLKALGKGDTEIDIEVTAQDGATVQKYKVIVHKPFGTIKGSIQLGSDLREAIDSSYGTYVEYIANATLFNSGEFDWDGIVPQATTLDDTELLEVQGSAVSDKDDGSYEIYVLPGTYDLLLERLGFLANVVKDISVTEGAVIDLGNKVLIEGDVNRSGIIDLDDMIDIVTMSDTYDGDGMYQPQYDFGQKGFVNIDDLVSAVTNSDSLINIEIF